VIFDNKYEAEIALVLQFLPNRKSIHSPTYPLRRFFYQPAQSFPSTNMIGYITQGKRHINARGLSGMKRVDRYFRKLLSGVNRDIRHRRHGGRGIDTPVSGRS